MRCAKPLLIPALLLMLSLVPPADACYAQQAETLPSDIPLAEADAPAEDSQSYRLDYVPLDNYKLEKWGTRSYMMYGFPTRKRGYQDVVVNTRERVEIGKIMFQTIVKPEQVIFNDTWADPAQEEGWAQVTIECKRDNLLTMQHLTYQQGTKVSYCDVTNGKYELDQFRRRRAGDWPEGTLTEASLLRILTMLPRAEGISYSIDHYSLTPDLLPFSTKGDAIVCHGTETLKIDRVNMECTKYTFRDMQAWVRNVDDTLVRFYVPGKRELVLSEEQSAFAKVLREAAQE